MSLKIKFSVNRIKTNLTTKYKMNMNNNLSLARILLASILSFIQVGITVQNPDASATP
ncbi:hypothetical protein GCM10022217_21300 [Chryseobacterium ginsenosidimutans]